MVQERCNDGPNWYQGGFNQPGHSVSATVRLAASGVRIRVYCTIADATTEWCFDDQGPWYKGAYTTT